MLRFAAVFALLAFATAVDITLNGEWEAYKKTYNKNYGEVESMR